MELWTDGINEIRRQPDSIGSSLEPAAIDQSAGSGTKIKRINLWVSTVAGRFGEIPPLVSQRHWLEENSYLQPTIPRLPGVKKTCAPPIGTLALEATDEIIYPSVWNLF